MSRLAYFRRFCSEVSVSHLLAQLGRQRVHVDALQQFLDCLGAHHGLEAGGTELLVEFAELLLFLDDLALFDRSFAGLDHHVSLEVQHRFQVAQRDVEDVADAAGQALEEPDVRAGRSQFDVAQALAANLGQRDFHAALVADDAAVLHALVLAAQALPVGDRAENPGAEQAVALRLEGAVVDRLRLGYFAVRPAANLFRRGEADPDGVEIRNVVSRVEWARAVQIASFLNVAASRSRGLRGRLRLPEFVSRGCWCQSPALT